MFPVAIDYSRFSAAIQELGDSQRRQKGLAANWSERTGIPIDLRLSDEGVSGRNKARRTNSDRYDLALFLDFIKSGRVQPGDYLLVENFDRLSREETVPAQHLLLSILVAGVKVVQLAPYELTLTEKSDMFEVFRAILELSRGHGESERKHQLCSASYANNRAAAARGEESYQGRIPAWLRREGDARARHCSIVPIPERIEVVRLIYQLAANGYGHTSIARELAAREIPSFGTRTPRLGEDGKQLRSRTGQLRWVRQGDTHGAGRWTRSYISQLLRDVAARGELVTKTGEVLPIPAAVSYDEWHAAQGGRAERNKHRGRSHKTGPVNLFSGLLIDAQTCKVMYSITRQGGGKQWRVISNASWQEEGTIRTNSFPEPIFEQAIRECLDEIDYTKITQPGGLDEVAVLAGQLEKVQEELREIQDDIEKHGASKTSLRRAAKLEADEIELEEQLRIARQTAAHPRSESWGRVKGHRVETAEERLRYRSILRRIVESIHVLIVPRGWDRLAAVQIHFQGSNETRQYLIIYRKARVCRRKSEPGEDLPFVRSYREAEAMDLRQPAHVEALRQELVELDLEREVELLAKTASA